MEVSEYLTISLRIGNYKLPTITIKRNDELFYRKAERIINERLGFYATRYPDIDDSTHLCMAALDIALALKREEERNDTAPLVESMKNMLKRLDKELDATTQQE